MAAALVGQHAAGAIARQFSLPLRGGLGTVYGKAWGPVTGKRVLGVHGWMDNAGTFDRLAPYLPSDIQLVAVDLPGHGLSYHKKATYLMVDYVQDVKRIVDALGWTRFTYMGHSNGAAIGAMFAGTFPEMVERLLLIEGLAPFPGTDESAPEHLRAGIESNAALLGKPGKPYDSASAAIAKMRENNKALTEEAVQCLAARGMTTNSDGTTKFNHDPFLRANSLQRINVKQFHAFLGRVVAPTMIIRAKGGWPFPVDYFQGCVDVLSKSTSDFEFVDVEGDHHVHLTNPQNVAAAAHRFLEKSSVGAGTQTASML
ncbi:hydrolase, variant [Capsaspora owczarzaki ATCC 30864]|uniref:Hydrolase n=1 Tax=Capsaspora owczarzaki (strain ATCC 30864) TaxID=595528 RepID=E9C372_CAPO3|nr:hydrolase [Capsaspora owczarzaki ATCC 30864]XP_011270151.1 hydrolase, variant [Capsaspora owczarzaki ATCC 30864]KJE90753.1 hydrolase [Capsaspora owczarzaki ATCC 30864]|eukprot:XP_004348761.1 hydrolase [Capsaspora owczarzaki ATCC 30864]